MNESSLITILVMIVGFVVNAIYQNANMKGIFGTKIAEHDRRLEHIEDTVVWKDTCNKSHEEVIRRFNRLENAQNRNN